MEANRLRPTDRVKVETFSEGTLIATYDGTGFRNVTDAIAAAYENSGHTNRPAEDYVFRVTDEQTGTSARYRINAGGNVKILPEE